ncbi:MAG: hypothetical protein GY847_08185 [Proteobacteria bacterium]|nr:hypothetical protein [Pseudomonadota bacterium]
MIVATRSFQETIILGTIAEAVNRADLPPRAASHSIEWLRLILTDFAKNHKMESARITDRDQILPTHSDRFNSITIPHLSMWSLLAHLATRRNGR